MNMTMTFDDFCDRLMSDDHPMEGLEPERSAAEFSAFFSLSARPTLSELADKFERVGIGKVSPAKLPRDLRGVHYTLPDGSYAIRYQEDHWEGSSEYTLLHEAYEIVHETLGKRGHEQPSKRKVCLDADRFAAEVLMQPEGFGTLAEAWRLDVTKTLNAEGIPTTNGKKWLKTTIHTMLDHEAYTGTLVWGAKAKDGAPPVRVEDAHPAIVSKRDFQRARKLLASRAPKKMNPRRASSPYLLSGLVKCETCGKAMTAAEAKSGRYTYYIYHSLLKRGKGNLRDPQAQRQEL